MLSHAAQQALSEAVAHVEAGRLAEAEQLSREVLRGDPRCARALHILGVVARRSSRLPLAIAVLRDATVVEPNDKGIRCELGMALADSHREQEAVVEYKRALAIDPGYGDACMNLAAALDRLEQPEEAEPFAERAVELRPGDARAWFNLGNVRRALAKLAAASDAFDTAIRLDPTFANAHWNQACCRLLAADFTRGWPEYEWRERAGEVVLDHYPQPRWQGESLEGQTILVHAEQGIGDEILFASCLPELLERAGHCVLVCDPRFEQLFARSFPQATVYGLARRKDRAGATLAERIDKQIPAGSLPLHFRPTAASFPQRRSFLIPEPEQVSRWEAKFSELGEGPKIGISWRAGGQPTERRKRTTKLTEWAAILAMPGVHFINMQYGETGDEVAAVRQELGIVVHDWPDADPLVDLDAFAAKVAALDLIVSVGNATVHLAGALGTPVWAMLPKIPGWRWMLEGHRSPWYESVRLFRQRVRGDWAAVVDEVAAELDQLVAKRCASLSVGGGKETTDNRRMSQKSLPSRAISASPIRAFDPDSSFASALEAFNRNQLPAAESLLSTILEHAPRHAPSLNLLGQIARQTSRLDLAIRMLTRAAASDDRDPAIHFNLALALEEANQLGASVNAFGCAIALDPGFVDAYFGLAKTLRVLGRKTEALAALEQTIKLKPSHHKALNLLGGAQLEMARWGDAERSFRAAVALQPTYMAAHNNLGLALEQQGRLTEALAAFDRAVELDEHCLQAVSNLGNVLAKLGQTTAADLVRRQTANLRAAG